jgi:hypothetical protein
MTQNTITAGDAVAPIAFAGGNDGTLVLQTGAAGAKVNAVSYAADGTPTQIKGTTLGSAPTPVPSGSAPLFACRAWVNFDGTTASPCTIRGSGNVASVTKNGTGDYTINFTTAMPDANYSISAIGGQSAGNSLVDCSKNVGRTDTAALVNVCTQQGITRADSPNVYISIFR